jgi:hypothetical protein
MQKLKNKLSDLVTKVSFGWYDLKKKRPISWIIQADYWLKYRLYKEHKYNLVDTGLKPGYYEVDQRMFHACFNLLVEFIEHEQAWMSLICSDEECNKVPWWMSKSFYRKKHGVELGMKHLHWAMSLTMEINDNGEPVEGTDLQLNHIGTQGWAAKEMKELYTWYKITYPKRFVDKKYIHELEEFYEKEETDMLIRLMNVRRNLWT